MGLVFPLTNQPCEIAILHIPAQMSWMTQPQPTSSGAAALPAHLSPVDAQHRKRE